MHEKCGHSMPSHFKKKKEKKILTFIYLLKSPHFSCIINCLQLLCFSIFHTQLFALDNALMHGFGGRFSVSNCIYDNIMETIKNNCSCGSLSNCTMKSEIAKDCALQEFNNPYDKYLQPKHYCKESCNDQVYKL